jgi:hypothetical protein
MGEVHFNSIEGIADMIVHPLLGIRTSVISYHSQLTFENGRNAILVARWRYIDMK